MKIRLFAIEKICSGEPVCSPRERERERENALTKKSI